MPPEDSVDDKALLAVIRAARPSFRNGADRIAYALHAYLLCKGYRLVAVGTQADAFEKGK